MELRAFGRTGLTVSALGFGCGAVGGLLVRGSEADQERVVARAVEAGITYFDTAADYGGGESERGLGRVLRVLKPKILLGTKARVLTPDRGRIGAAIVESLEASLLRLGRDSVDLLQLHNPVTVDGRVVTFSPREIRDTLSPREVREEVVPALQRLRRAGKIRFTGMSAMGDTDAIVEVIETAGLDSVQVPYNLLNPSATMPMPAGFPAQDHKGLMLAAQARGMGVIGIRALAGGALSGEAERPAAAQSTDPIASGDSYETDLARARHLLPLVREGYVDSLVELAMRFAISTDAMSTALLGISTMEQLDIAIAAMNKGKLPTAALARVAELQRGFAGIGSG